MQEWNEPPSENFASSSDKIVDGSNTGSVASHDEHFHDVARRQQQEVPADVHKEAHIAHDMHVGVSFAPR